ncbi:ABC transporter substrate-binding protein [Desulfitobacterium chlororespirans]|uniref:NitT/TauT family transport system substrate-binding protein n=1 Tax=Desulfitobacterium chlororespirans DSM 11544 TaxID=1121395 RepID=A0A1M7UVR1_9FIRM|nr:ABC transporter substrate-binding protein [Desulfitobacterium chlororespirans]SHN87025.1 NitT/TauT family transport system substrate-binding protein [Desulfitobacterium chlororespirans DSM 11544]
MKKRDYRLSKVIPAVLMVTLLLSGCITQNQKDQVEATKPEQGTIYYVQTSPANMLQQLNTGEIDAFVAWEPNNAQAVREGTGRYLMQSGEIASEHPCCILALAGTEGDEDLALALAWANVKSIKFINDSNNQEKMLHYAMDFTGRDKESVGEALTYTKYVSFPDRERLADFLGAMRQNGTLVKEPATLGYESDTAFFQGFMNKEYMDKVNAELEKDPSWTPPSINGRQITLGYINQDLHHLPMFIAVQEGYYEAVGLVVGQNLQLKGYANGVAVMEAFKVKELNASYLGVAPAVLKQINDGIALQGIAGANDEGSAIVVAKDSDIRSISDLKDKTVAIPGLGTVQSYILDLAARNNGMKLQAK